MIRRIRESVFTDTNNPTDESTIQSHCDRIKLNITKCLKELTDRMNTHDDSKYSAEEFKLYDTYGKLLHDCEYGSDEYNEYKKKLGPALDHHFSVNRHHPEHFEGGIKDMNLIDLLEMVCDWISAQDENPNLDGFIYNKDKFSISDQLYQVLLNTGEFILSQDI